MARGVINKLLSAGPTVPGTKMVLGTFLVLALGVSTWWVVDTLFPKVGIFVRGQSRQAEITPAAPTPGFLATLFGS